jgi:hypothetical protein
MITRQHKHWSIKAPQDVADPLHAGPVNCIAFERVARKQNELDAFTPGYFDYTLRGLNPHLAHT